MRVLTQAVGGTLKGHRQIAHHRPPSEPADTTGALLLEVPGQDLAPALCSPDFKFVCLFGCAGSLLLRDFFSSCSEQGLLSSHGTWASRGGGHSCCRAQAPGA